MERQIVRKHPHFVGGTPVAAWSVFYAGSPDGG